MPEFDQVYLNIGRDIRKIDRFLNIARNPAADWNIDVRYGLPFDNETVQGIYCANLIEHLTQGETLSLLRECRRVLTSNGTLRILTQDLDVIVGYYADNEGRQRGLDERGLQWIKTRAEYLNVELRHDKRQWLVNEQELARLADLSGLVSARRCLPAASKDTRLGGLENDGSSSLIMEFGKRHDRVPETPLVSIVIPAYKPQFFKLSLESAAKQNYQNLEILVLDDSPGTQIEQITREFAAHDNRIIFIKNAPSLGEAANLTRGITLARGEFIKPLYDDDILLPEATDRLLGLFHSFPDARLAAGCRVLIDSEGKTLAMDPPTSALLNRSGRIKGPELVAEIAGRGINLIGEPTVLMFRKRDALSIDEPTVSALFGRECPGLGDVAFMTHLMSRGDLAYTVNTVSLFRIHKDQTQRQEGFREIVESTWRYFREQVERLGFYPPFPESSASGVSRKSEDAGKVRASGGRSTQFFDRKATSSSQSSSDEPVADSEEHIAKPDPSGDLKGYTAWLRMREWTPGDQGVLAALATTLSEDFSLDLIIRVRQDQHSQLADTLDSLNYQVFKKWHVHVVSQDPVPAGVDSVDCISWHTVPIDASKRLIDDLVAQSTANLIVELPAGAVLDPRCLWRIAREANEYPEICAFFCDDDIYDESGNRQIPRFKPGANPAWLLSQDLAGPLFVRREAWHRSGGASEEEGSPWFDQLLRVAKNVGWNHIRHIPDVLLSFASRPPSDMESCLRALGTQLQRDGASFQLELASQQSWHVRHVLQTLPRSTVAIFSTGQFDLLNRCLTSILENTRGIEFDVVLSVPHLNSDVEFEAWLGQCEAASRGMIRVVRHEPESRFAERFNAVLASATTDQMACMDEGCVAIAATWLERMTSTAIAEAASIVSPRIVAGGSALVESAGAVIGFDGFVGSPYQHIGSLRDAGYLDYLLVRRDISVATSRCFLISTEDARSVTGADVRIADLQIAVADLSQRLLKTGGRLLYEPASVVIHTESESIERVVDARIVAQSSASTAESKGLFSSRWLKPGAADPFWNANLSLAEIQPSIETDYLAQWQHQPTTAPRILARPLTNGQGNFRITSYLSAARSMGLASECVWLQSGDREPTLPEIMRLGPDAVVVQHYILDRNLRALHEWSLGSERPFTVFAMDDLLTNMDLENPFRMGHAPNNRSRIKYALEHCDRLVVSTDFLAECCANLIADIRVVPNRLSMHAWIPLQSRRRTTPKPRIGWAGGTTHQGDLVFLKEIIEQTRSEADWIFMGMCPPEIKPLLAEYHPLVPMADYPAYLASLNLDIAVAPLAMTPFNQAKSNLRLLEYGMLGLPVICTDIDPYRNSPACRVANVVQEWIDALRARIHDADAREAEGRAMRQWVHHNFILEHHINQWVDAHTPG